MNLRTEVDRNAPLSWTLLNTQPYDEPGPAPLDPLNNSYIHSSVQIRNHRQYWVLGIGIAFVYAAAQAVQLAPRVPGVPWLLLFVYELPVWCTFVAITPAIFFLARRLPLFGANTIRNSILHLLPALILLVTMFVVVEATRQFIITPLIRLADLAVTPAAIEYRDYGDTVPLLSRAIASFRAFVMFLLLTYYGIVLLHQAVKNYRQLMEAQLRGEQLVSLLARSQLDALKLQLQPHFLFNTLNTVSSLMSRDIILARRTLARLSDLLRQSLRDSARHEVEMVNELDFLDAYIEIQQARFGSHLVVKRDVDAAAYSALIPAMLLQPLVENSIRHGMREGGEPLEVTIKVMLDQSTLRISVVDNGVGLAHQSVKEGLGLSNTRERLAQLYGENFELWMDEPADGGCEVAIWIPHREADAPRYEEGDWRSAQ